VSAGKVGQVRGSTRYFRVGRRPGGSDLVVDEIVVLHVLLPNLVVEELIVLHVLLGPGDHLLHQAVHLARGTCM
jgi:hypothetical protein